MTNPIELAISKAGGMRPLGRALGIAYQTIQRWKRIPAERVIAIEQVTGIPRERLRPDLYRAPRPRKRHELA